MYIVYAENQSQKSLLQNQFLQKSGHFAIPFQQLSILKQLISSTCYEINPKKQSLLIQKFKNLITGLVEFNFSFSLWREILSIQKKNYLMIQKYHKYLIEMDKFFFQPRFSKNQNSEGETKSIEEANDEFQKALNSYKILDVMDFQQTALFTSPSFDLLKNQLVNKKDKTNHQNFRKITNTEYFQTNFQDQTLIKTTSFKKEDSKKIKNSFESELKIYPEVIQNSGISQKKQIHEQQNFMESFRKSKQSPVAEMIINDESIGEISKLQINQQEQRKKLADQLHQKTKTIKSKEYNKNIKMILLNKKIKETRKSDKDLKQQHRETGFFNIKKSASDIFSFGANKFMKEAARKSQEGRKIGKI